MTHPPRIYLAGPEVFLPNAAEIGERKRRLCARYGFEGVYPIDPGADLTGLSRRDIALRIGSKDEDLIRACDGVVANLTPFRGPSADVGTAYEMGFAAALGKLVCAYTNDSRPFEERTLAHLKHQAPRGPDDVPRDADGMAVEEWGLIDNLMLESCIANTGGVLIIHAAAHQGRYTDLDGFEQCLRAVRDQGVFERRR